MGLMLRFAERTGLTSAEPNRRYLWTDAFAVCNFLSLGRQTGDAHYGELAVKLVERVHQTLGKHRPDDVRKGWISGLGAAQGEAHPTRGGLRIGKQFPERKPNQPFDRELEWDRDGQYFHYLAKWMHALDQVARFTGKSEYNAWARELAAAAHRGFVYPTSRSGRQRMYWKMSIDMSRPLVPSMGQHDPLDGYITSAELVATALRLPGTPAQPKIDDEMASFASMVDSDSLATADPLGLGGLLADAYRVDQLLEQGAFPNAGLRDALLAAALSGLESYSESGELRQPAERRLAFRELGLAIGLQAVLAMKHREAHASLAKLQRYDSLRHEIIGFWIKPEHQRAVTWTEHRDINEVMLATALTPDGFLVLIGRPAEPR